MTAFRPQNKMAVASTHFFRNDEYFFAGLCGSFVGLDVPLASETVDEKQNFKKGITTDSI